MGREAGLGVRIKLTQTTLSRIVSIWHLTVGGSGMFQKVIERPANIGYSKFLVWLSLVNTN
jgi:hypothetical protein